MGYTKRVSFYSRNTITCHLMGVVRETLDGMRIIADHIERKRSTMICRKLSCENNLFNRNEILEVLEAVKDCRHFEVEGDHSSPLFEPTDCKFFPHLICSAIKLSAS